MRWLAIPIGILIVGAALAHWEWLAEGEGGHRDAIQLILAALVALGAVFWFYRKSQHLARIDLAHRITIDWPELEPGITYLRVATRVSNIGEVPFKLHRFRLAVHQLYPLTPKVAKRLEDCEAVVDERLRDDGGSMYSELAYCEEPGPESSWRFELRPGETDEIWASVRLRPVEPPTRVARVFTEVDREPRFGGFFQKPLCWRAFSTVNLTEDKRYGQEVSPTTEQVEINLPT